MKRASTCSASLLAVPLATAFTGTVATTAQATPVTYNLTVNPTLDLVNSYIFLASTSPILDIQSFEQTFTAGTTTQVSYTDNFFDPDPRFATRPVFIGVYEDEVENESVFGLTVSLLTFDTDNQTNPSFTDLFSDNLGLQSFFPSVDEENNPLDTTIVEDPVVAELRTGAPSLNGVSAAFVSGFAFPFGTTPSPTLGLSTTPGAVTLGNFTNLTNGGILNVTSVVGVPEPASLALLGAGGLMLLARRRR